MKYSSILVGASIILATNFNSSLAVSSIFSLGGKSKASDAKPVALSKNAAVAGEVKQDNQADQGLAVAVKNAADIVIPKILSGTCLTFVEDETISLSDFALCHGMKIGKNVKVQFGDSFVPVESIENLRDAYNNFTRHCSLMEEASSYDSFLDLSDQNKNKDVRESLQKIKYSTCPADISPDHFILNADTKTITRLARLAWAVYQTKEPVSADVKNEIDSKTTAVELLKKIKESIGAAYTTFKTCQKQQENSCISKFLYALHLNGFKLDRHASQLQTQTDTTLPKSNDTPLFEAKRATGYEFPGLLLDANDFAVLNSDYIKTSSISSPPQFSLYYPTSVVNINDYDLAFATAVVQQINKAAIKAQEKLDVLKTKNVSAIKSLPLFQYGAFDNHQFIDVIWRNKGKEFSGVCTYDPAEHKLYIAFAGSKSFSDWITNFTCWMDEGDAKHELAQGLNVHAGMIREFRSSLEYFLPTLYSFLRAPRQRPNNELTIVTTGHSLGGVFSVLMTYHLKKVILPEVALPDVNVVNVNFGMPMSFDKKSARIVEGVVGLGNIITIYNIHDLVPSLFPLDLNPSSVGVQVPFEDSMLYKFYMPVIRHHSNTRYFNLVDSRYPKFHTDFTKAISLCTALQNDQASAMEARAFALKNEIDSILKAIIPHIADLHLLFKTLFAEAHQIVLQYRIAFVEAVSVSGASENTPLVVSLRRDLQKAEDFEVRMSFYLVQARKLAKENNEVINPHRIIYDIIGKFEEEKNIFAHAGKNSYLEKFANTQSAAFAKFYDISDKISKWSSQDGFVPVTTHQSHFASALDVELPDYKDEQ